MENEEDELDSFRREILNNNEDELDDYPGNYSNLEEESNHEEGIDLSNVSDINQYLREIEALQEERRSELNSYMEDFKAKAESVSLPKDFQALILTGSATNNEDEEKIRAGLDRIKKLDAILAKKTKQAKEFSKKNKPLDNSPARAISSPPSIGPIHNPFVLSREDEVRIESILNGDRENAYSTKETTDRLAQIDLQLQEVASTEDNPFWEYQSTISGPSSLNTYRSGTGDDWGQKEKQDRLTEIDKQLNFLQEDEAKGTRIAPDELRRFINEAKYRATKQQTGNVVTNMDTKT